MKDIGTNAGIDKEFNQKMQEAAFIYEKSRHENNPPDHDFIKRLMKERRKERRNCIMRIAAIFTMAAIMGVISVAWVNSDGVYGGKYILNKCITFVSPLEGEVEIDDDGNVMRITTARSEEEIKIVKNKINGMVGPTYIPQGYSFKELTVRETSERVDLEYLYQDAKDGSDLVVMVMYYDYDADITIMGDAYVSEKTGKTMYVAELLETNQFTVTEIGDEYDCTLFGEGNKETGIQIMESIREY